VNTDVLDLPDVIVVDRNASSNYARFAPSASGLQNIDRDLVFAEYWTHSDPIEEWYHGSIMCAEVLVPDRVDPCFAMGVYVSSSNSKAAFDSKNIGIASTINPHLFFR